MDAVMGGLERQYPQSNSAMRATVTGLYQNRFGDVQPVLLMLLTAVALVLLIACGNVANLLLARATTRQKEFALRATLGAGGGRMVRQLLTESVLLSLMGGGLGLLVALWAMGPLLRAAPAGIPRLAETRVDAGVFLFTLAVSVLTGILFGLAPAIQSARLDLNSSLKEAGRTSSAGRAQHRLRSGLLMGEVALALVLVIASGLLLRSLQQARAVEPGFNPRQVLALDVILSDTRYRSGEQRLNFFSSGAASHPEFAGRAGCQRNSLSAERGHLLAIGVRDRRPSYPAAKRASALRFQCGRAELLLDHAGSTAGGTLLHGNGYRRFDAGDNH
jgi:putative ABC transport system permease protein